MYFIFILFVFLCVLVAALALLGNKRQKQHAPNVFTHDLAEAQPALTHLSKDRTHTQTHTPPHTQFTTTVAAVWRWRLSQGHFSCAQCDIFRNC